MEALRLRWGGQVSSKERKAGPQAPLSPRWQAVVAGAPTGALHRHCLLVVPLHTLLTVPCSLVPACRWHLS